MALLSLVTIAVIGCKESGDSSKISPTVVSEIKRIQTDNALSDEEISEALERWVEMYAGTKNLLESDDLFGSGAWTPERLADLMNQSEKALKEGRHEDRMLAIYSVGHLSALADKRYDRIGDSLRGIIARYHRSVKDSPNEVGENILQNIHELAERDPELKRLLEQNDAGEQDPVGTGD